MIRLLLTVFTVPGVIGIVVTDPPPAAIQYKYSYDVQDPVTGDTKTQHEVRQGNIVTGQYSVIDPDGTKRIVDYNVHPRKGFSAVVHTEPAATQRSPTPVKNYVTQISNPQKFQRQFEAVPYHGYYTASNTVPLPYNSKNYQPDSIIYFSPGNDLTDGKNFLHNGQYFIPSNRD